MRTETACRAAGEQPSASGSYHFRVIPSRHSPDQYPQRFLKLEFLSVSMRVLFVILMVGMLLRAVHVGRQWDRPPSPDAERDYLPLADSVLHGQGFVNGAGEPDSRRGPTYPLFVAAATVILPGTTEHASVVMNVLLDLGLICIVWTLTQRFTGRQAAGWAAAAYACNPLSIYACALVAPEILFAFLLAVALLWLHRGLTSNHTGGILISGIAMGASALTRATPVLLVPLLGVWILLGRRGTAIPEEQRNESLPPWPDGLVSMRVRLRQTVVFGAAAAFVVLPWTLRNWIVFEEFIPIVANGGANFHLGAPDDIDLASLEDETHLHRRMLQLDKPEPAPPELHGKPAARDQYFYRRGSELYGRAWEKSPVVFARFVLFKSLRLWYATHSGRYELMVGLINAVWVTMALAGCFAAWQRRQFHHLVPLLLTIAYFQIVLTAMYPLARYVVGFAPCLCVMTGPGCAAIQNVLQNLLRRKPSLTPAVVTADGEQ
ncbi:MAG: glycosyltransferase family 39 protein [Planctomycetaceae bacterium]|nr:glycosyltransferase family 39 protein [Planctomycetaceae bacterium]